jgi:hypothetical protein
MGSQITADPLAWSAFCAVGATALWLTEHHLQRFTAWLFGCSAFTLVVGWGELQSALAALLLTGRGMVILVIIAGLAGFAFYLGGVRTNRPSWLRRTLLSRKPKDGGNSKTPGKDLVPWVPAESPQRRNYHHRVWTHVAAIVFGGLAVIVVGGAKILAAAGGKSLASTGRQFMASTSQINSGHAAAAVPAAHRPAIWIGAVIGILILAMLARRHEKRKHGGGRNRGAQPGRGLSAISQGD